MDPHIRDNTIPVFMIIGAGHSGSTLLDVLLGSHRDVVGLGEVSHAYPRSVKKLGICGCGVHWNECLFWQEVTKDINLPVLQLPGRTKWDFLMNRQRYMYFDRGMEEKLDGRRYVEETKRLYRNILQKTGKKYLSDSSQLVDRAELLSVDPEFDIIGIHLVRDGRGFIYSHKRRGRTLFRYMRLWFAENVRTEIFKWRTRKHVKWIYVRYKDLVRDPQAVLTAILAKNNVAYDPDMIRFYEKKHHHMGSTSSLKMLFDPAYHEIRYDDAWRQGLSVWDRAIFGVLLGWLNFFYEHRPVAYKVRSSK